MLRSSDKPLEDREFPDESDSDAAGDAPVEFVFCRACGEPMYEQAPRCPHCGQWVVPSDGGWRDSRKWYVRGGLYVTKVLLVNWLFWLLLTAVAAAVAAWEFSR